MDNKKQAISYLFFGVVTTIINIVVFHIFYSLLDFNMMFSNFIAWVIAVIIAFITNKIYVFESKDSEANNLIREFSLFIIARILSLGIDMVMMVVLVDYININGTVAKIISNVVVIIFNYFASRYLIFKKK